MTTGPHNDSDDDAGPDLDPVARAMADARRLRQAQEPSDAPDIPVVPNLDPPVVDAPSLDAAPAPADIPRVEPEIAPPTPAMTAGPREPEPRPDPDRRQMARIRKTLGVGKKKRSLFGRIVKWVIVIALIPFVLSLIYIPSFVRPVSTLMLMDLATLKGYDRRWVPLEDIAPVMQYSVVMSEDGQFCRHHGVDLGELRGVVNDALDGGDVRGASTIPMQTVKNLFLFNIRSVVRKAVELPIALFYDFVTPKKRIMETYLNIAEWGDGIYGVEAAAQHYFGVSAKNLTRRQAALLTVALPNPYVRNPAKPGPGMQSLARRIERMASQAGGHVDCLR